MKKQYFKVGDLVTCVIYGKGEVVNYGVSDTLPVLVEFESGRRDDYTYDGRYTRESKRVLHKGHIDIPEPELKPIVSFEKKEFVWVRKDKHLYWECRPFFGEKDRKYECYPQDMQGRSDFFDEIRKYEDRPF